MSRGKSGLEEIFEIRQPEASLMSAANPDAFQHARIGVAPDGYLTDPQISGRVAYIHQSGIAYDPL